MSELKSATAIAALIEAQTTASIRAMKSDLDRAVFGDNYSWGAYTVPTYSGIKGLIESTKEQATMSDSDIARKAVEKRKEALAERLVEEVSVYFENFDWSDGDHVKWKVTFHETPDKTYNYVAVRGGSNWYITGDAVRHTTDSLVMKIVELNLRGAVTDADWDD